MTETGRSDKDQEGELRWKAPPQGWVKINTDASFHGETGTASARVIIRDPTGKPLLTAWLMLKRCSTAEAEAEAFMEEVRTAAEWVRQPAWVESDCLNLMGALRRDSDIRRPGAGVLREIRAACNLLPDVRLEVVGR
jgi:hypothetical protein